MWRPVGFSNTLDHEVGRADRLGAAQQSQTAEERHQRALRPAAVWALTQVPPHAVAVARFQFAVDVGGQPPPREQVIEVESRPAHVYVDPAFVVNGSLLSLRAPARLRL